mgnify:CR=1 FL=1
MELIIMNACKKEDIFEFLESGHIYKLNGTIIPGVSAVLSPLSDFSSVHPAIMKQAQDYGSNVHKTIELYLNAELDEDNLDPHLKNVLEQFKIWDDNGGALSKELYHNWIIEKPSFHPSLKYAGTPDIAVIEEAIVDIKSRPCNPIRDILQLTAYEAFYGKPGSHRLIVLELYEDRYKEVDLSNHKLRKQAWGYFRYLLDHYYHQQEFNRKLQGWKNSA